MVDKSGKEPLYTDFLSSCPTYPHALALSLSGPRLLPRAARERPTARPIWAALRFFLIQMTQQERRMQSVNFTPCCPSRASFLAGGFYSHHTNVTSNAPPNGGVTEFMDSQDAAHAVAAGGLRDGLCWQMA